MTSEKPYTEQIAWDLKEKKFYIKRTFAKTENFEKHPLSEWGFVRKVETCILIVRRVDTRAPVHD